MQHIQHRVTRRRGIMAAIALSSTTMLLLAGCASSPSDVSSGDTGSVSPSDVPSGDTGSGFQEVIDKLALHSEPQPFDFKGAPFDVSSVNGSTVWWVIQEANNPFLRTVYDISKEALASVGVKVVICDGRSNPVDANNCILQGVAQQVAAIQVDGPDPASFANSAATAEAAGIPVLTGAGVDSSMDVPSFISGVTSPDMRLTAELAADFVIVDSQGAANVLVISVGDVIGAGFEAKAFQDELKKYCPNCTSTEVSVNVGNWASDLGTTTSAALSKDPTIDYIFPVFDPMTQFVNPAIVQMGKASSVTVVTGNGILPFMQELATGTSVTKGDVGTDMQALGYIEADQILRAMTGNPVVKNSYSPIRFFDVAAAKTLVLTPEAWLDGSWYGGSGSNAKLFASIWLQ